MANVKNLFELANKGDANAQYELGKRHLTGEGLEIDSKEAVRWFKLASEQKHLQENIDRMSGKIDTLEKKPARYWEKMMEKIRYANTSQNKARAVKSISNKVHFRAKNITRD